jgi:hypothetical protein
MSTDLVRYSVSGNIAEILLDRGPVNALSMDLIDALLSALAKARDESRPRNSSNGFISRSTIPSTAWASRRLPPSMERCGPAA